MANSKSSLVQVAQAVLDETLQAIKVVNADPSSGGATETTALDILTEVTSIDAKTPALDGGNVPVDVKASVLPTGAATEATSAAILADTADIEIAVEAINAKTPALVSGAVPTISGLGVPTHDALSYTSGATTDTYLYFSGGLAGTQVAQVVITYTDSTKALLQSVVRS